jgi:hypothetical protein
VELPAGWGQRRAADVALGDALVPLTRARQGSIAVVHPQQPWAAGDHVTFLARGAEADEALAALLGEVRGTGNEASYEARGTR